MEAETLFRGHRDVTDYQEFISLIQALDCVDISVVKALDFSLPPLPSGQFQTKERIFLKLLDICPLLPVIIIVEADEAISDPSDKLSLMLKHSPLAKRVSINQRLTSLYSCKLCGENQVVS